MKKISLTRGYVATVDDEDFESLAVYRWHYGGVDGRGYARRDQGGRRDKERLYISELSQAVERARSLREVVHGLFVNHGLGAGGV